MIRPGHRGRGFTLLEVMVVVTVVGLLMRVAIPRFQRMGEMIELDRAVTQVAGELRRARAEAVRRNRPVTFTPSTPRGFAVTFVPVSGATETVVAGFLPSGVSWTGSPPTVTFRSFGPPSATATYTLTSPAGTRQLRIESGGAVVIP